MATSITSSVSKFHQNYQRSKMCLQCILRHGFHSMASSRLTKLQYPMAGGFLQRKFDTMDSMAGQRRHMHLIYFIRKSLEDQAKKTGKVPGPKFTMRYGVEGSIARELISFGAKVHFTNGVWYGRKTLKSWYCTNPGPEARNYTINAIDAEGSFINQGAFERMATELFDVKYLYLDGCKYIDDHCLASLVHMRDSLTHLSVNRCLQITDSGLASLHKLRKLEKLNMNDLPLVTNAKLIAILLEDSIPNLRIGMVDEQIKEYKKTKSIGSKENTDKDGLEHKDNQVLSSTEEQTKLKNDSQQSDQTKEEKDLWRDSLIQEKTQAAR